MQRLSDKKMEQSGFGTENGLVKISFAREQEVYQQATAGYRGGKLGATFYRLHTII